LHVEEQDVQFTFSDQSIWSLYGFDASNFKQKILTVECKPLPKRSLTVLGDVVIIEGQDMYRKKVDAVLQETQYRNKYMSHTAEVVPAKNTVLHTLRTDGEDCALMHCHEVCNDFAYQYSKGCGPTYYEQAFVQRTDADDQDFYLLSEANRDLLFGSPATLESWTLVHQGVCVYCQDCQPGHFNELCNDYSQDKPEGECQMCSQAHDCAGDQYLWHPDGEKGCEPPATSSKYIELLDGTIRVRVTSNYQCKTCASFFIEKTDKGERIYVVGGCGQQAMYEHYSTLQHGVYANDAAIEVLDEDGDNIYRAVVTKLPYCPPGFYYNENADRLCSLQDHRNKAAENDRVYVYEQAYRGFKQNGDVWESFCCQECITCSSTNFERKDLSQYQTCLGDSLQDTQNHCVEKCPYGYYETNNNGVPECHVCTDCSCGESRTSFEQQTCAST
jgi:hypothetical protein